MVLASWQVKVKGVHGAAERLANLPGPLQHTATRVKPECGPGHVQQLVRGRQSFPKSVNLATVPHPWQRPCATNSQNKSWARDSNSSGSSSTKSIEAGQKKKLDSTSKFLPAHEGHANASRGPSPQILVDDAHASA